MLTDEDATGDGCCASALFIPSVFLLFGASGSRPGAPPDIFDQVLISDKGQEDDEIMRVSWCSLR